MSAHRVSRKHAPGLICPVMEDCIGRRPKQSSKPELMCDHHQQAISEINASSPHGPIHTNAWPQISNTPRHSRPVRHTADQRSSKRTTEPRFANATVPRGAPLWCGDQHPSGVRAQTAARGHGYGANQSGHAAHAITARRQSVARARDQAAIDGTGRIGAVARHRAPGPQLTWNQRCQHIGPDETPEQPSTPAGPRLTDEGPPGT